MEKIYVISNGEVKPVIKDYAVGTKLSFVGHVLEVAEEREMTCKRCFFDEPWFDCSKICCLKSDRMDARNVCFKISE